MIGYVIIHGLMFVTNGSGPMTKLINLLKKLFVRNCGNCGAVSIACYEKVFNYCKKWRPE